MTSPGVTAVGVRAAPGRGARRPRSPAECQAHGRAVELDVEIEFTAGETDIVVAVSEAEGRRLLQAITQHARQSPRQVGGVTYAEAAGAAVFSKRKARPARQPRSLEASRLAAALTVGARAPLTTPAKSYKERCGR